VETTSAAKQRDVPAGDFKRSVAASLVNAPPHAVWVCCGMFSIVAALAATVPDDPAVVDRGWSRAMRDIKTPRLDRAALVLNEAGRGIGRGATLAAIALALAQRRRWPALRAFAVAELATPVVVNGVKVMVDRRRPAGSGLHAFGTAFPSGHTAYAGATMVALTLLRSDRRSGGRGRWVAAGLGTAAMAWSRTYLQLHWLTDVTAGALLGSGVSLAVFARADRTGPPGQERA
jgi:membrane-associated phospholipid phosphatase